MTNTGSNENRLLTRETLRRATRAVVANAVNGDFSIDPVIGADLSKTFAAALVGTSGHAGPHPLVFLADHGVVRPARMRFGPRGMS